MRSIQLSITMTQSSDAAIRCEEKAKGGLRYEVILADPVADRPPSPPASGAIFLRPFQSFSFFFLDHQPLGVCRWATFFLDTLTELFQATAIDLIVPSDLPLARTQQNASCPRKTLKRNCWPPRSAARPTARPRRTSTTRSPRRWRSVRRWCRRSSAKHASHSTTKWSRPKRIAKPS